MDLNGLLGYLLPTTGAVLSIIVSVILCCVRCKNSHNRGHLSVGTGLSYLARFYLNPHATDNPASQEIPLRIIRRYQQPVPQVTVSPPVRNTVQSPPPSVPVLSPQVGERKYSIAPTSSVWSVWEWEMCNSAPISSNVAPDVNSQHNISGNLSTQSLHDSVNTSINLTISGSVFIILLLVFLAEAIFLIHQGSRLASTALHHRIHNLSEYVGFNGSNAAEQSHEPQDLTEMQSV